MIYGERKEMRNFFLSSRWDLNPGEPWFYQAFLVTLVEIHLKSLVSWVYAKKT